MTETDRCNQEILRSKSLVIDHIAVEFGHQRAIDYANSLIDMRAGCVGGDGSYYPRAGFMNNDVLLGRLRAVIAQEKLDRPPAAG